MLNTVRAYVNHGRWVADCCRDYCNNAMRLQPHQEWFRCSHCGMDAVVTWPTDADAIWEVLERRPVPDTRNWYPLDHDLAVRAGIEHGQSVADLLAENDWHGVRGMK